MPKTLIKEIRRMIKATKARFISLTAIVAIGTAFFVGVSATSPIMAFSVDQYDKEEHLKDITIYANYGFDDQDIETVSKIDDVNLVEGTNFVDVIATCDSESYVARIHGFNQNQTLNRFVLVEGRLPKNNNEAVVENGTEVTSLFKIGDHVKLKRPDHDLDSFLSVHEVEVVGTIDTPLYLCCTKENSTLSNRYIETYFYMNEDAFIQDFYTELNVSLKQSNAFNTFSDEYNDYAKSVKEKIEDAGKSEANARRDRIKDEAYKEYNKGLKEYEDGKKTFDEEIAKANRKLNDAKRKILDGEIEINDGVKKLQDGQKELDAKALDGRSKLDDGWNKYHEGEKKLQEGINTFESKKKELEDNQTKLLDGIDQANNGIDDLKQAKDGLAQIEETQKELKKLEFLMYGLSGLPDEYLDHSLKTVIEEDLNDYLDEDSKEMILEYAKKYQIDLEKISLRSAFELYKNYESNMDKVLKGLELLEAIHGSDKPLIELIDEDTFNAIYEKVPELKEILDEYPLILETLKQYTISDAIDFVEQIQEKPDYLRLLFEGVNGFEDEKEIIDFNLEYEDQSINVVELGADGLKQIVQKVDQKDVTITTVGDFKRVYNEYVPSLKETLEQTKKDIWKKLEENNITSIEELDEKIQELEELVTDLESKNQMIIDGLAKGQSEIDQGKKQLEEAYLELCKNEELYKSEIRKAQTIINDGWAEIEKARIELNKGKKKYQDGLKEFETKQLDGQQALDEAYAKLVKAKDDIEGLEEGKWIVLDRSKHYATRMYRDTVDQMKAIAAIFPVFFFMVAALVCLTTMTRMVQEQRGQIGVLRALGYTKHQCASIYIWYAILATIVGELIGNVVGLMTFPKIIYSTWGMMYIIPEMQMEIPWILMLVTNVSFLLVMMYTTRHVTRNDMEEVPAQLLRPKPPKLGKNIWIEKIPWLWNRFSFTWKVTVRNLFRYKRRFFMTVFGVAGCCALLVTGFGIRDSINTMMDLQFGEIFEYDGTATMRKDMKESEARLFLSEIRNRNDVERATLAGFYTAKVYGPNEFDTTVRTEVYDDAKEAEENYCFRDRRSHKPITLDDDGVIISEHLAEVLDVKVGDTFEMESENGVLKDVRIDGITEMYVYHFVMMTDDYYEKVFGTVMPHNTLFIKVNGDGVANKQLQKELAAMDDVSSISFYDVLLDHFYQMIQGLDFVVWTLIVSSMSLAFVVLGNLTNVNIAERQREIATLKVLGFHKKEVESYIYKENNVLVCLGALLGVPIGQVLHYYIMHQVEMDYVIYGRDVTLQSKLISMALTIGFGLLVNQFMKKYLKNIKMVESLKSNE